MVRIAKRLNLRQIIILVKQLPKKDKVRLLKQLEQETWAAQLEEVVRPIRNRMKSAQITDADIDRIVGEVRQRRYESRSGRL